MSFTLLARLRKSLASVRKDSYTASHIAVMTCLADRINDKTGICFPSMQTIADESYIGERQARKVISQLEQDGVVAVHRAGRRSNHYRLVLPTDLRKESTDFVGIPNQTSPGFQGAESAQKTGSAVAEARLTYNPNLPLKPASDGGVNLLSGTEDTASQSFLSEAGSKTQNPVTSSGELTAPCHGVNDIHALLMRKLRAKSPGPSTEDRKRLQFAIEKYGLPELHQMVTWVFKQKSDFWRKLLKAANWPCSLLCNSLPSIKRQFDDALNDRTRAAEYREQERLKVAAEVPAEKATAALDEIADSEVVGELDYDPFEISAGELED